MMSGYSMGEILAGLLQVVVIKKIVSITFHSVYSLGLRVSMLYSKQKLIIMFVCVLQINLEVNRNNCGRHMLDSGAVVMCWCH